MRRLNHLTLQAILADYQPCPSVLDYSFNHDHVVCPACEPRQVVNDDVVCVTLRSEIIEHGFYCWSLLDTDPAAVVNVLAHDERAELPRDVLSSLSLPLNLCFGCGIVPDPMSVDTDEEHGTPLFVSRAFRCQALRCFHGLSPFVLRLLVAAYASD